MLQPGRCVRLLSYQQGSFLSLLWYSMLFGVISSVCVCVCACMHATVHTFYILVGFTSSLRSVKQCQCCVLCVYCIHGTLCDMWLCSLWWIQDCGILPWYWVYWVYLTDCILCVLIIFHILTEKQKSLLDSFRLFYDISRRSLYSLVPFNTQLQCKCF
jgi:hypothetical protein